jgi:hypothetical protein
MNSVGLQTMQHKGLSGAESPSARIMHDRKQFSFAVQSDFSAVSLILSVPEFFIRR